MPETSPVSVKKFDIPPGADPTVPAELGGSGFKGEGWQTNSDYNISGNKNAVKGGEIVLSLPEYPITLRSVGKDYNTFFNNYLTDLLYESLLSQDPVNDEYIPRLATHWKISDDKKTLSFRINPDARWADGMPVTAEDVAATWKLMADPEILDPYLNSLVNTYELPVAESKYIVTVKSKEFSWRQFHYAATAFKIFPAHLIDGLGGKGFLETYNFKYLAGTGPYLVQENDVIKDQSITIRRRSDYWGEKEKFSAGVNNFDAIKILFILDESLEYEKFKKGEIDILSVRKASAWNEKYEYDEVKRGIVLKRKIFNEYPTGYQGISMNTRVSPFSDINVRKAFAYLFDRKKFNEKLFYNAYFPIYSYFPGTEFANSTNPQTGFNPDSAAALLAASGWTQKNSEGYLVKNGKVFEADLQFQKGMDRWLTIYQEDLKKAGIKLNLKETDYPTAFKTGMEHNFRLLPISWTGNVIPNPEGNFTSELADKPNTTNWSGIKDGRIDSLCTVYNALFDKNERIKVIREIDLILSEFHGYVLMWYAPYHRFVFHNKFSYPDGMIGKYSSIYDVPRLWYFDPEKSFDYQEAVKDKNRTLNSGDTENKYWIELKSKQ
ncbi:MAG: ABC transporter substrate-binding protein [Ignavibacteria bacterium]|nr:ABC transporter substrate-binding protein [Ignavibacteria bacterium]